MLNIFQIYFSSEQLRRVEFRPYNNANTFSPYLENKVIADLCESGQLFDGVACGVFSWRFRTKGTAAASATVEGMLRYFESCDALSFYPKMKQRKPPHNIFESHSRGSISKLEGPTLAERCEYILEKIGQPFDTKQIIHPDRIVYSNHFLAKPDIYKQYYEEFLKPAIEVMDQDETARAYAWGDSKYHRAKIPAIRERWQKYAGVPYYTLHAFILERFFSVFLQKNSHIVSKQYGRP